MAGGNVYAGTSGWAYATWKPDFYPAKLSSAKFLGYYATRLNSVEVNYTFRRYVTAKLLAGWIAATPANFKFTIKANQSITHIKRLRDVAETTSIFLESLEPLREAEKLGLVLFQLPPYLKCDVPRLEEFLRTLPKGTRSAMEFRHDSWFTEEVYERLRSANVAVCQAESEKLQTPGVDTADFSYFRFRRTEYSPDERKLISGKAAQAATRGDAFVYFKHEDTPAGALYAETLLKALNPEQPPGSVCKR